jgi:protein-L-isoaspartate(D-aspartate) O-methyltransferase
MKLSMENLRKTMVERQILPCAIKSSAVTAVMEKIPREIFLPSESKVLAYADICVPLLNDGSGLPRYEMRPVTLARMLDTVMEQSKNSSVLVVGVGGGYVPAILAELFDTVVAIEEDKNLLESAIQNLESLGYDTTELYSDIDSIASEVLFDVVFFNGGTTHFSAQYASRINLDGSAIEIRVEENFGKCIQTIRVGEQFSSRYIFSGITPLLFGHEVEKVFVF